MTITFEISDVTSLCGEREQNVKVSGLTCGASEMALAQHLTEVIVKEAKDFVVKVKEPTNA